MKGLVLFNLSATVQSVLSPLARVMDSSESLASQVIKVMAGLQRDQEALGYYCYLVSAILALEQIAPEDL